ncbi:hypothetical protein LJC07_06375 [Christensenellaceae bacterium OttesenSCG-928-L17]|nr:hypothetical protein [Christensenellaceae bacterium OttesenSCG-928-L17]
MSKKITKVIAALGVVAGLGIAALPLSSYAAEKGSANISVSVNVAGAFNVSATNAGQITATAGTVGETDGSTVAHGSATVLSNLSGTYTFKVGTPYSATADTTALAATGYTVPTTNPDATKIIPAGVPANNTSAWGYKIISATSAALGGGNVAGWTIDSTYQAATAFTNASFVGGRTVTSTAVIPSGGDVYTFQIGASISNTNSADQYSGTLTVFAAEN